MNSTDDDFGFPSYEVLKKTADLLGIEVHVTADAFGRLSYGLDHEGMLLVRDTARFLGHHEIADGVQKMLDAGPTFTL